MNALAVRPSSSAAISTPELCGRPSSVAKRMPTTTEFASLIPASSDAASGAAARSSIPAVGAGTARMTVS